ncbi:MAG: IS66 family transposase [Paludibacteraceae bacterium]|nr:IS66 family transposase [Paludibacteraceae bacterium]
MNAQEQKMLEPMQGMLASQAESLRLLTEQSIEKDKIIKNLEQRVAELSAQLAWFQRQLFGRKSEKLPITNPNQLSLFDDPVAPEVVQAQEEASKQIEQETPEDKKRKRQNRKMMEDLPVLERIVLRPEGIDDTYKKIGEEVTRLVKHIPAQLGIIEYVREKYAKDSEDKLHTDIKIAPMPMFPIYKGIADATLLSEIILNKYEYHLPLYRQVQQFRHLGFKVNESTLASWIKPAAELLQPLYERLVKEIFKSHYIQCDETTTPVIDKDKHKTNKEYLWMIRAVNERLRCFHYDDGSRAGAVIEKLANENRYKGYLQCDGFAGYETAFRNNNDVQLVNCMAHIRRHFEQALDENRQAAEFALGEIQKLYQIERNCTEANMCADDRKQKRDELSRPIMVHLKAWMEKEGVKFSPSSQMGKAVTYAYTRWDNMMRYLEEGSLMIDNNLAENAIRPITLGRKNYLFCGNHSAAGWMATICSLIGTCKEQNINPRLYLNDVIAKMPYLKSKTENDKDIFQLLPQNWIVSHPEACIGATQQ